MGTACNKSHLVRVELSTLAGKSVLMVVIVKVHVVKKKWVIILRSKDDIKFYVKVHLYGRY